ncbi:MAG: 4-hydroxy-tetrahydrodipicolinate reductase [Elusimicrobiota bacterium]|jgi:4-hydroxy-tetrahydrodipicolinate reductase|nr:4-hydroxy-tetrahydrodipicolinate reductase [Elusimicrobiota bacterium]
MKIVVCGAAGRMGQAILNLAKADTSIEISGAVEFDESPAIGTGSPKISKASELPAILSADTVLIDFTNPQSALKNLEIARQKETAVVIGTTGFDASQKEQISKVAKEIPVLLSPNMSIGVNLLFKLVQEVSKAVSDYDIELVELHHNKKKDAPSGTAVKLAEIIADALGRNIEKDAVYERHSVNKARSKDEIGIMSVRAGDIVGDHTIYFAGPGERIELTHRAHSRDTFAAGAIRAAKWLSTQKSGLYDMQDVLSL